MKGAPINKENNYSLLSSENYKNLQERVVWQLKTRQFNMGWKKLLT